MINIKYELKFLDYWHVSSGESGGAIMDSLVIRDNDGFPFISGKTLKGLFKDAAEELGYDDLVYDCFGDEDKMGESYFSSAYLDKKIKEDIYDLKEELFHTFTFTALDEEKIAKDDTLREIEFVIPITLYGEIRNVKEEYIKKFENIFKMVKRIGLSRNRGFGRCQIRILK